jgi:glyoxylase-like metal-dependent hydrolase (beta-lactamase superfamily II)
MYDLLFPGLQVVERGWLSANLVVVHGRCSAAIDSGYFSHEAQTVALVQAAFGAGGPQLLLNTHLHSDHCGGNAALQQQFAAMRTLIPPGQAAQVVSWDVQALSYQPTGQHCPRFRHDGLLQPGQAIDLGDRSWQIHAAAGHDPHSVVLFEPLSRTLVSADALWENGFGAIFPELEGVQAFDEVGRTLDLIESLEPVTVVPGHGPVFAYRSEVMVRARERLASFVQDPRRHAKHGAKVLLKFKLLEVQQQRLSDYIAWACRTPQLQTVHRSWFSERSMEQWLGSVLAELQQAGAAVLREGMILDR